MKKYFQCIMTLITVIVIILVCFFTSIVADLFEFHLYIGWQEVNLTNSYSIKVPGDWVKGEKNGLIYFTDSENTSDENIIFFQSRAEEMFSLGDSAVIEKEKSEKNIISDNFQSIVNLNGTVNSLGAVYGDVLISADDVTYNEKYVEFANEYQFYTFGEGIDDETLKKIADSVEKTE